MMWSDMATKSQKEIENEVVDKIAAIVNESKGKISVGTLIGMLETIKLTLFEQCAQEVRTKEAAKNNEETTT